MTTVEGSVSTTETDNPTLPGGRGNTVNSSVHPGSQRSEAPLPVHSTIEPLGALDDLQREWSAIEADSDCSFFMAWGWIGPWLHTLAAENHFYVYRCRCGDTTVALGVLSLNHETLHKVFRRTVIRVNETRRQGCDMSIEYNGLLVRRGHEAVAWWQFLHDLQSSSLAWEELALGSVSSSVIPLLRSDPPLRLTVEAQYTPWSRALGPGDTSIDALLSGLSRNRRWQIRRTIKAYESEGALSISAAASAEEALAFFTALGELHTRRWNRVGEAGSFANPRWVEFHRRLIADNFAAGHVQLLRIRCGDHDLGYLYNLLWRRRAYMLQSGFALEDDNHKRPGYLSHCMAMVFNARLGLDYYDFMCGDAEYKRVLGGADAPLLWVRLQRPLRKFTMEKWAVRGFRSLQALTRRAGAKSQAALWGWNLYSLLLAGNAYSVAYTLC